MRLLVEAGCGLFSQSQAGGFCQCKECVMQVACVVEIIQC
jgi:hypothetical protein